jgi:hypothetical protein
MGGTWDRGSMREEEEISRRIVQKCIHMVVIVRTDDIFI